jgi:hypothetical protein
LLNGNHLLSNVLPGQNVTVRIETETPAANVDPTTSFTTDDPAFGIWRDYSAAEDVAAYARELRAGLFANPR